jgi:hypothetical protein
MTTIEHSVSVHALSKEPLLNGEHALDEAPHIALADGRHCIPQHYLHYQHTLQSVEELILDIECDPRYPIFVSQDTSGIYIQIGAIGFDNYHGADKQQQEKILYGRKWRVEPQLPSSEIIQTVFLALKKAREHEVRELFRLIHNDKLTTPFNSHHDLPLLANSRERLQGNKAFCSQDILTAWLQDIDYDGAQFEIIMVEKRHSGQYLIELIVKAGTSELPELLSNDVITFMLVELNVNLFLQQLMQQLIHLSDRYIDEQFRYRNFSRFSWYNDVQAISLISAEVRQLHKAEKFTTFQQHWQQNNYETDRSRIPKPSQGPLWNKIWDQIALFSPLANTLPISGSHHK